MSIAEALKQKSNSKHLSMIVNADGKIVQAEKREDEEQAVKEQEIIDLLFAAGYFRARIKGLTPFDKVVGGMTWCIDSCDMDIDVDLLFQDNLTIGQKIALTEKIVAVLPKMKCPHRIEPHQIQGLDFIHIYPVIQWLVKHSMERRKELGDYYKSYAVKLFDKMYPSVDGKPGVYGSKTRDMITHIQEKYRPQRNFRRTGAPPAAIQSRVESTLFEYGHFPSVSDSNNVEGAVEARQVDEVRSKQLMDSMASMPEQESRLAAGLVGSIVSMQADEIAKAVEHYTELQAQTEMNEATQLQRLREKEKMLLNEQESLEEKLLQESSLLEKLVKDQSQESLSHMLSETEQGILKKLQSLVMLNDSLKQQELEFREQCKTELNNLKLLISEAEESDAPDADTEEITRVLEELTLNVSNTRLALGKKNREVARLQRQLDQVPTRAELAQYQRRFMELYGQVSAKHRETKQFFTLYNTLNDTNMYLGKELDLLTSIADNYAQAMTSEGNKTEYTQQIEKMIKVIESIKLKVSNKLEDQRRERDHLTSIKLELVEQGRQCVAAYKQAGIEATNNENLLNQLKNLQS